MSAEAARSSFASSLELTRRRFSFASARDTRVRLEGGDNVNDVLGVLIGLGPIVAELVWSNLRDRARHRANGVRADITATANRVLGGESVLGVRVEPAIAWRPGRVHLSAPGGYEFLVWSVSGAVINRLPRNYELVVVHRG